MTENSLVIFTKAAQMLAEAVTIQQAKELKDLALTAADWAKRKGMGEEAIQHCRSYALEAERKMGEMLKETERAAGGRPLNNQLPDVTSFQNIPTLAELGLSKRESVAAQILADLPQVIFNNIKEGKTSKNKAIKKEKHRGKIEAQTKKIKDLKLPTGLFDIIVVDPPWEFRQEYDPDFARGVGDYPTMSLEQIKAIKLPIKKDCVLWLWVTNNMIKEGFEVLEVWGFVYRNILTWDKEIIGIGSWLRNQTEHCLMATQGHPIMNLTNQPTIIREKRTKHSAKPEKFYELIDELCIGEKIDYFSRKKRNNWFCYGDEIR